MKKHHLLLVLLCTIFSISQSVAQLAIGQWREHVSYKKGIAVTQSNNFVYCASESGIFRLNKEDYSLDRLSKITGLSDVGATALRYNLNYKTLVITYKNSNIDLLINDNTVYNIPDIKRKIISGKKVINSIFFRGNFAYLSCGFGIVVLDLSKKEITDTYYLGKNSTYVNVRCLTSDDNYFFAATDSGIYRASLTAPNLADYNSWDKLPGIPQGIYNAIANINGKIYTNRSENLMPPNFPWDKDTIYCFSNNFWTKPIPDSIYHNQPTRNMEVFYGRLLISFSGSVDFFNEDGKFTDRLGGFLSTPPLITNPQQAITDINDNKITWIVDKENGLIKNYNVWNGTTNYIPEGPYRSEAYSLQFNDDDLWVTRGEPGSIWIGVYNRAEVYKFSKEAWSKITIDEIPGLDSLRDFVTIAIDPADKEHLFISSLGAGIAEIKNGKQVGLLDDSNSALQSRGDASFHWVGCFSMAYDKDENLWMSNTYALNPLVVRKKDGTWQNFSFQGLINTPTAGQIIVCNNNQKWIQLPRGNGIMVYDENGTWQTNDDKARLLKVGAGNGNLPSNEVECMVEDKNGEVWIGTDKGITVFYCADNIFSTSCDAQQIYIQQDGHTQILLLTEVITTIAVDGANRKWIGTQNSGVYLMSADGTEQIQHFTEENSPLISNEIKSIAIQPKTGEVFFATSAGIVSYQSDAIDGSEDYSNTYVFPNPVKPDYEGPIAITGLVGNANVKITDVSGALVYETKALGGQAIWYGKNFKGEKAQSGVYMVFCSNEDGSKTFVTKILLIN